MPIISFEADEATGIISLTATGENIVNQGFYMGVQDMSAALHISDGNNTMTSDYIPLVASDINKRIFYNSYDGQIVVPSNANAFGAKIVSNTIVRIGEQYSTSMGVITFDRDVTKIGYDAFNNCDNLVQITINDCIEKIGEYAFANCDMLYFIGFGSKSRLTEIGDYAFYHCPVYDFAMPNSVISVGNKAFSMCSQMTSLTLSEKLETIGNNAFSGCYVDVVLGEDVSKIGDYAFDSITSVYCKATTPPTLGLYPFSTGYTTLYVPTDAVDTYKKASGWDNYKEKIVGFGFNQTLTIDYTTTDGDTANIKHPFLISNTYSNGIGKATFYGGDIVPASAFSSCYTLKSVTIPQNTKTIGQFAFCFCMELTEVSIPNSVTNIGSESFKACSHLEAITLPSNLTTIGSYAFDSCRSLTEITIPSGVTSIGDSAFVGCSDLTRVYCKPITPPAIKNQIFGDRYSTSKLQVYVPEQSVDAYNATEFWWDYVISGYNY